MKFIIITAVAVLIAAFVFKDSIGSVFSANTATQKKSKGKKPGKNGSNQQDVQIINRWDLPDELVEVSGIAYLDKSRFACVQDEEGVIFIFNMNSGDIEKRIPFAGPGDYEGLTLNGDMAYVVRADGVIYETDMKQGKTSEYKTYLTVNNNIEGLCFDQRNNRLLLAGKDIDEAYPGYKGIYAFDLANKELARLPAFKIELSNAILRKSNTKKSKDIMPSSIGIHPLSGEIYITDGTSSQLLVMNANGDLKRLYELGKSFTQPEGISFNQEGAVFISNEGKKNPGNIMEITLN